MVIALRKDTLSLTVGLLPRAFDDCDLFRRQFVKLINKVIDLAVQRGALRFIERLVTLSARVSELNRNRY